MKVTNVLRKRDQLLVFVDFEGQEEVFSFDVGTVTYNEVRTRVLEYRDRLQQVDEKVAQLKARLLADG